MQAIGNKYLGDSDRASRIYFSHMMEPLGLEGNKFIFFVSVCRHPGITQSDVVRITLFDKSVVTRAVAQLEKRGLIYRVPDTDDKRVSHLFSTEEGEVLFQEVSKIVEGWNLALYSKLQWTTDDPERNFSEIARASRELLGEKLGIDVSE